MNSPSPPSYSPLRAPAYSAEPRASETLLAATSSRRGRRSPPTRAFTWSKASITLSILGKEEGLDNPVYGQNGFLRAEIALVDPVTVVSATVKVCDPNTIISSVVEELNMRRRQLEGIIQVEVSRMIHDTSVVEAFEESVIFMKRNHVPWSKPDELSSTMPSQCPSLLLFEEALPSSYQDGVRIHELPPTFSARSTEMQAFSIRLKYTLTVCVVRRRQSRFRKSDVREKYAISPPIFSSVIILTLGFID